MTCDGDSAAYYCETVQRVGNIDIVENVDLETCEFLSHADPSGNTNRPEQALNSHAVTYECA